jgi:hypothetical protein
MDCLHENIIEKVCQECGLKVGLPDFVGWVCTPTMFNTKNTFIHVLIKQGIGYDIVMNAIDELSQICKIRNVGLKGSRKKAVLFASVLRQVKCDPYELAEKLDIPVDTCAKGVHLYEAHFKKIKWDWSVLLRQRLKKHGKEYCYDNIFKQLLIAKKKTKMIDRINKYINDIN